MRLLQLLLAWLLNILSYTHAARLVIGIDGGTESIRACCFDAETGRVVGQSSAVAYATEHPQPGWAEQSPQDWYDNLGVAVRGALASLPDDAESHEILALACDTTCCSVVALDKSMQSLRPCLLWMDQRAAPQTRAILEKCRGDPALAVNCGGEGPLSAEWMTPKALWIAQNEPQVWKKAAVICEYQDYINYRLTGVLCASSCNAASRWHWNGEAGIDADDPRAGRPLSLYGKLGIPELAEKLPSKCLPMGAVIGGLTSDAAQHLGLREGLPVVQGGPDAFVAMIGLGCIHPGQLCLITGSSHLHCVVSSAPTTAAGTWGAYRGAPLPGINFAEGGQSSTGSLVRWARKIFGAEEIPYSELDEEASAIAPGSDGLVALETFQGARTPLTDPLARGAMVGLTLSHTRAHIFRALMEAVCFGTRACVEGLAKAGHACDEMILAGGATRSPLWLQMHADVTGKPVIVCENTDAPLLGCAILAAVGVGVHATVQDAVGAMVRVARRIEPDPVVAKEYDGLYTEVYSQIAAASRPISHAIQHRRELSAVKATLPLRGGATFLETMLAETLQEKAQEQQPLPPTTSAKPITISPSLLACNWAHMADEVFRCLQCGANRLHVDIFDGVFLDSPRALTFGPQMVEAIRASCEAMGEYAILDLHVCVDRPQRYIVPMAEAGADRFIFQYEAVGGVEDAMELAVEVVSAGMACGISINPSTDVEEIFPLLETNCVDLVDVLAVEPGFGGQLFQHRVLEKVRKLDERRKDLRLDFEIMVDGGIKIETAGEAVKAGADILVAGTFLFQHPVCMEQGLQDLLQSISGHDPM